MPFKRPAINGKELHTLQELAMRTGLSLNHLRERTRHTEARRGALIPSYKIGRQIWVDMDIALSIIYADKNQQITPIKTTPSVTNDDISWVFAG